jgi:peptide chain release factor 1
MARMELDELREKKDSMEEEIRFLLLPADPEDEKNAIVEIRAGTGGDEASIFAGDLFRMYSKYCENRRWKMEVTHYNEGTAGGLQGDSIQCQRTGSLRNSEI